MLHQQMRTQSPGRNAVPEHGRRRNWPATTSKLNDDTCDTLSPQNFTKPAYSNHSLANSFVVRRRNSVSSVSCDFFASDCGSDSSTLTGVFVMTGRSAQHLMVIAAILSLLCQSTIASSLSYRVCCEAVEARHTCCGAAETSTDVTSRQSCCGGRGGCCARAATSRLIQPSVPEQPSTCPCEVDHPDAPLAPSSETNSSSSDLDRLLSHSPSRFAPALNASHDGLVPITQSTRSAPLAARILLCVWRI